MPSVSATTVTLASSLNPAAENQAVTLIAMVAGQQGGTPTGTVTFENGAVTMGTVTLSDGFASFNQSFAIGGTEPIVAVYSGDATFAASSSPVLYEGVGGYRSITSLTATPTPSAIGQSVIITAMVSSTYGSPTGTVTLMNGSTSIGTASLVSGLATFTETFSSPGAQSITAVYSGDVSFAGSVSSALQQTVMANFTLTLTGSGAGSVSSLDGKINGCTIAGGANCSTTYTSGSLVTLVPTPTNGSSFYWSTGVTGVPCSGSGACTLAITNNTTVSGVFTSTGFSAIQASPTFSIDYNDTASQFPVGIRHGQGRFWDTPGVEWAFVQTSACTMSPCPDSFSWTSVDTLLGTMAQNSVYTAQYALARTPTFLSSNPSDTTCHGGPGECDAPIDLNFDGTGADLIWRNWVAAISAHVNASGYADTHAHVKYWEIWNEPDTLAFWGGSAPATQGTFDQLVRMEEDAYCIIKGGSFINDYTGESCTAVLATVTSVALTVPTDPTAVVVMPSYHGGSTSLALAACFLYGTGASGGLCQNRSLHYGGAGELTPTPSIST